MQEKLEKRREFREKKFTVIYRFLRLNLSSSSTTEKGVHDSIMSEHIKEMAALQRTLLIQQHKAHMANIERQKDAVRDEIEQVANMLINGRNTRQNVRTDSLAAASEALGVGGAPGGVSGGSAGFQRLKQMFLSQGKPRMAQLVSEKFDTSGKIPTHQAVAWHQRFSDNFRLRKLQHQALRLRGPVLLKPSEN